MLTWGDKDPDDIDYFEIDWGDAETPRLVPSSVLVSSVSVVEQGLVEIDSEEFTPEGLVTIWLSGGVAGSVCVVKNRVTTNLGQRWDQKVQLRIKER